MGPDVILTLSPQFAADATASPECATFPPWPGGRLLLAPGSPFGSTRRASMSGARNATRRFAREHAANEGRLCSWDSPPARGHPAQDYNCRCEAVPYIPGETEYAGHEIIGSLASSYDKWAIVDFFRHFYEGRRGRPSPPDKRHHSSREAGESALFVPFNGSYRFEYARLPESIPHGHSVVEGEFVGVVIDHGDFLAISGATQFRFSDVFTDPLDVSQLTGIDPGDMPRSLYRLSELGGTAYPIQDVLERDISS